MRVAGAASNRDTSNQRTKWAYIFGAICPAEGKGAGLVIPSADTHAMQEHLKLISAEIAPGAHAILIVDQAGWHIDSHRLFLTLEGL